MDHTNFPLGKPIPIDVFLTFENRVDWNTFYGRWGTDVLIYSEPYEGLDIIPQHLKGKATHVWLYFEM